MAAHRCGIRIESTGFERQRESLAQRRGHARIVLDSTSPMQPESSRETISWESRQLPGVKGMAQLVGHEDFEFFEPVLDDDHSRLGEIRPVRRENRSHLLSFRR